MNETAKPLIAFTKNEVKVIVIDWDYNTFIKGSDDRGDYYLLDESDEFLILKGWPACGEGLEPTLFKRDCTGKHRKHNAS